MKILFSVPGSKVYINRFYRNHPKSFINISITGKRCSLLCKHCRAILLKSMADASKDSLLDIVERNHSAGLRGILVSGGFNRSGRLELQDRHYADIREIKKRYPRLKVLIHCGFTDKENAKKMSWSGIDGVLLNIIGSRRAIESIYRLKGFRPSDYYGSFKILKDTGLKIAPHIVTGLESPRLKHEYGAVDRLLAMGADNMVFVTNKRLRKDLTEPGFDREEFLALIRYTARSDRSLKIAFGCAQPRGREKEKTEIELLRLKIGSMAFPSEKAIEFAIKHGIDYEFRQECCALI